MWKRIKYLLFFFAATVLFFVLQKPVFMYCNATSHYGIGDYVSVMLHGLCLDATTAGYLTAVPLLAVIVSVWLKRWPMRKVLLPYYAVAMLLASLIFIGDLSLFSFWESKLDASVFIYIDSPKNAAASVSAGYIVMRALIVLLLAAGMTWALAAITPRMLPEIKTLKRRIAGTALMLPVGGLLFVCIRGGVSVATANVGDVYFSADRYLNLSAVNPVFNLIASMKNDEKYEDEFNFFSEEELPSHFRGLYSTDDDETVPMLNTQRPNILVILMESFGATMVESLGGEPGVAPNLERLSKEGIFFTHAYANSFRTDRGTVCTFSGYPGLPTLSVMKVAGLCETMPNIATSLKKQGYATDFLYGGDINFTNMRGYLHAGGFEKITAQEDFPISDSNLSKWGVRDDIAFERLFSMLRERTGKAAQKPWFTAFLTLSSHEPFEVPFRKFKDDHFNAFAYTDSCIGNFIERFRKLPQWKNTLVVLLPDHGIPYPKNGEHYGPKYFRIPIIWTGGAVKEPFVVNKIVNQTDLAATLLAQLGLKHDDFTFSRNVLSRSYTYPFAFYSFPNGFGFVDSTGVSVYDNASGKVFYRENADGKHVAGKNPDGERVNRGKAILQTLFDDLGRRNRSRFEK